LTKEQEIIKQWRVHPYEFVKYMWGWADDFKHSSQQEQYWEELGKLVANRLEGKYPEYAEKIGISVMSGHGTGKDCASAQTILWFMYCFPNVKIPTTAPSAHQLRDVLWAEISKWIRKSRKVESGGIQRPALDVLFAWQSEKIYLREKQGKEWFAVARTVSTKASEEAQAETLAGFHEDYLLFMIDEASGVPDPVYKPIEGCLTGILNLVILIFNPTRSKGYAADTHTKYRNLFVCLRWNSEESEVVEPGYPAMMAEKYGKDSTPYRIRVLGLPPLAEKGTLIPMDWIMDAVGREITFEETDPVIKGVDVGAGGDKSINITKRGGVVTDIKEYSYSDTMQLVSALSMDFDSYGYVNACIDPIGIGKGVVDRLREKGKHNIIPVDVRRSARRQDRFDRLRDDLWWSLREDFEEGMIAIPNDSELIDQLSIIKYEDEGGKVKVESKRSLRARGEDSPDKADGLMMTKYVNPASLRSARASDHRPSQDDDDFNPFKVHEKGERPHVF
jgi:hypothetical protein